MVRPQRSIRLLAAAGSLLAALVVFSGTSQAQSSFDTPNGYFEDASARASNDDTSGAIIQLKNALQLDDTHTPSLLLLGELLLESGEPSQAAALLSEALLLGADNASATRLLVDAYLRSSQFQAILTELPYDRARPELRAELMAAHAQAYLGLGRNNEASALIQKSRAIDPDNLRASLANATLALRRGQVEQALTLSSALTKRAPNDTRAWNAFASTLQYAGRMEEAIDAYQRAVDLRASNIDARISLIAILYQLNRSDEAAVEVAYLRENHPNEPRAAYFEALLASNRGDAETARRAIAEAANGIDALDDGDIASDLQILMIGALSHYGLGAYESALAYLDRYLAVNPNDEGAIRLHATTLLALNEPKEALNGLLKLNSRQPNDNETTALLAEAYSAMGNHQKATELLSRIDGSEGVDTKRTAQLGIAQFNAGQLTDSILTLEAAVKATPDKASLRLPLALAYMRARRWVDAKVELERLSASQPEDDNVANLLSLCLLSLGEVDRATELMETLIRRSPEYLPPRINLAKLAISSGELERARLLLDEAAKAHPEDARILAEQAALAAATGNDESALRLAERASQLEPGNTSYTRLLVRRYLASDMPDQAEATARKALTGSNDDFAGAVLYGQTLTYLGKPKQAALVYTQLSRNLDFNVPRLVSVARLQSRIGEHNSAISILTTALTADERNLPAQRLLISETLAAGYPQDSLELALEYQQSYPEDPFGYLAQGEAALADRNALLAKSGFQRAVALGAEAMGTLGLYRMYRSQSSLEQAQKALEKGLENTNELSLLAAYSDVLIARRQWAEAEVALTQVLDRDGSAWAHWNNRAFVRQLLNHDGAEADARRALELAPSSASVNDTLGWILVEKDRALEALPFLREAVTRDSDNPAIRYHLGAALAALGRQQEAEKELFFALESDRGWREKEHAKELLSSLQGSES